MSQENSSNRQPLIRFVNRQQMSWRAVDVERLVDQGHPARAIWMLVGRLDCGDSTKASRAARKKAGARRLIRNC
jgi:hypothetical protein